MKIRNLIIAVGMVTFSSLFVLRAQQTPSIQQMENSQLQMELQKPQVINATTNAETPELYPGENSDVGPQRILKMLPRRKLFDVTADSQFFYTGNALLNDSQKINSTILVNTIQLAYAPDSIPFAAGQIAPGVGFRSQWFNYDLGDSHNLSRLDFNAQTIFAGAKYTVNDWQYYGEFDYTRLLSQARYNEIYHEFVPEAGVRRMFVLNDQTAFVANYQIAYHASHVSPLTTDADVNNRLDNSLSFSLSYLAAPNFVVQPFYRIQYTYYPGFSDGGLEKSRNDLLNDFGTTFVFQFAKHFAARFFLDYQIQNSDYKTPTTTVQFHNLNVGGGLTMDFRF